MCIFCKIINGEAHSYKIYEEENTYAYLSIGNEAVGHTLVIPKKHYENVLDIPNDDLLVVISTVQKISRHYVDNCGYTGVNIMNASGIDAQQSVFHLHFHIMPRKTDDGMDTWPHLTQIEINYEEIKNLLKMY